MKEVVKKIVSVVMSSVAWVLLSNIFPNFWLFYVFHNLYQAPTQYEA